MTVSSTPVTESTQNGQMNGDGPNHVGHGYGVHQGTIESLPNLSSAPAQESTGMEENVIVSGEESAQRLLDENCELIKTITENQQCGKSIDSFHLYQALHRNLYRLAQLTEPTNTEIPHLLPPPDINVFSTTPKPPSTSSLVVNQQSPPNASVVPGGGVPLYRGKPSSMVSPYQHRRADSQKMENPLIIPSQTDEAPQPQLSANPNPPKSSKKGGKDKSSANSSNETLQHAVAIPVPKPVQAFSVVNPTDVQQMRPEPVQIQTSAAVAQSAEKSPAPPEAASMPASGAAHNPQNRPDSAISPRVGSGDVNSFSPTPNTAPVSPAVTKFTAPAHVDPYQPLSAHTQSVLSTVSTATKSVAAGSSGGNSSEATSENASTGSSAIVYDTQSAISTETVTSTASGPVSSSENIKKEASHLKLTPSSTPMQAATAPSQYPVRAPYSSASKYHAQANGSANPYYSSMGAPASSGAVGGYQTGYAHPMSQNPQQYGVSMAAQRGNPYVQQYSRYPSQPYPGVYANPPHSYPPAHYASAGHYSSNHQYPPGQYPPSQYTPPHHMQSQQQMKMFHQHPNASPANAAAVSQASMPNSNLLPTGAQPPQSQVGVAGTVAPHYSHPQHSSYPSAQQTPSTTFSVSPISYTQTEVYNISQNSFGTSRGTSNPSYPQGIPNTQVTVSTAPNMNLPEGSSDHMQNQAPNMDAHYENVS